jgi:hypothetical protein
MIQVMERRRRSIGAALVAYGLAGLVAGILVVGAMLAVGPALEPAVASVDRQRDAIVATLERSASALDQVAVIADDAAGAVERAAAIASQSADVSRRLADTLARLASTFGTFEILGNQPFAPLVADATQVAAQLRGIATDVDALGISLGKIGRGIPPLAEEVRAISVELGTLATELEAFEVPDAAAEAFRWLVVGIAILVAWLLVPAVVALAVGVLLIRGPREPVRP